MSVSRPTGSRLPARRRRRPAAPVVLATILLAGAGWAQAQLVNPGFEEGGGSLSGWQVFGNATGNVTVAATTPHSGGWVASVSGPPTSAGSTSYCGLVQGLATSPGVVWTASAHLRHNSGSALEGANQVVLKLEYYRRYGGVYGSADFIGETEVTALDAGSARDAWQRASLAVFAPRDAAEVRVALVMVQNGTDGGTALIDDVTLSASDGEVGPPTDTAWSLLWHDEFDGDSVDLSKWIVLDEHLIKNGELQYYDPEDVYIEDGHLVLRSRHHDPPVIRPHPNGHFAEFDYTSGLVESAGLFAHTYGWIEIRAKLPSTQGIWPAHWMLGEGFPEVDWPRCGEIDIMEAVGFDRDTVFFTRHWGDPYVHRGTSYSGPVFAQGFHTFALHWTAEHVAWYVDDSLRYLTTTADAGDIFKKPFYLILNTAVGGYWPGYPNSGSVFPQYHVIDHVRWYVAGDPGDFDRDGDVDGDDLTAFVGCFSGDGLAWDDPACRLFDGDGDGDVDCDDWPAFHDAWSGPPAVPPRLPECGLPAPRRAGGRLP